MISISVGARKGSADLCELMHSQCNEISVIQLLFVVVVFFFCIYHKISQLPQGQQYDKTRSINIDYEDIIEIEYILKFHIKRDSIGK